MIYVGRDNHASGGNFVAHDLRRELLFARNVLHLFSDYAQTGVVHLREVFIVAFSRLFTSAGNPLDPRLWYRRAIPHVDPIPASAILSAHRFASFLEQKLYALREADNVGESQDASSSGFWGPSLDGRLITRKENARFHEELHGTRSRKLYITVKSSARFFRRAKCYQRCDRGLPVLGCRDENPHPALPG